MNTSCNRRAVVGILLLVLVVAFGALFVHDLSPAHAGAAPVMFEIKSGDGFRGTVNNLYAAGLVRSALATEFYMLLSGRALELKPGLYKLSAADWASTITRTIAGGSASETTATIPEGSNIYQIDTLLSNALIIHPNTLIEFNENLIKQGSSTLEGMLFPDTYSFFTDATASSVVNEFLTDFSAKAEPLLAGDAKNEMRDLIVASIVEKEVPSSTDQKIVAGIILKRLAVGMPLDIDATVCYAKLQAEAAASGAGVSSCNALTASDLKIDSPYNTYRNKGLPPGPIGNPGAQAIQAALHPQSSPYWYYLSDPKTGATIYARTLAEQVANQRKYLNSPKPTY